MSVPFSKIYDRALFNFKDHDLLIMDDDSRNELFFHFLEMAQSDFQHICKHDLSKRDDELKEYTEDLNLEEINILALGIAYHWLKFSTLDDDKLKNRLNTSDYTLYSPANNLNAINDLKKSILKEYRQSIKQYSYYNGDLTSLNG